MKLRELKDIFNEWSEYGIHCDTTESLPCDLEIRRLTADDRIHGLLPDLRNVSFLITKSEKSKSRSSVVSSSSSMGRDSANSVTSQSRTMSSPRASTTDSVIGSPLRMKEYAQLEMDSSALTIEEVFMKEDSLFELKGLPLTDARQLLSLCSCSSIRESVCVLCDGRHCDGIVSMIYRPESASHTIITTTSMKVYDPVISSLTVEALKRLHQTNSNNNKKCCTSCSASYTIRTIPQPDGPTALLRLDVTWTSARKLLEQPPSDARVSINIRPVSGGKESKLSVLFEQLQALKGFCKALEDRQISWFVEYREEPVQTSVEKLFTKMSNIKTSVRSPLYKTMNDTMLENSTLLADSVNGMNNTDLRHLQDFTELLWPLLIECSSYKELCECLTYLFRALRKSKILPVVEPDNPSELARWIRSSDENNNYNLPSLTGILPLSMLVEIGVFKLRRDYLHFFNSYGITSSDLIGYYQNIYVTMDEQVDRLAKLHVAMETVTMATQYLNDLDRVAITRLCRHCLQYYTNHVISPHDLFSVPIHYKALNTRTNTLPPSTWSWSMTSQCESEADDDVIEVRTVCELTDTPSSGSGVQLHDTDDEISADDEDNSARRRYCRTLTSDVLIINTWHSVNTH